MLDEGSVLYADVKTAAGSLYLEEFLTAQYPEGGSLCIFSWQTGIQGEALATDLAICIAYNETTDIWGFKTDDIRSAGMSEVSIVSQDVMHGWLYFVQGTKISSESHYLLGNIM